MAITQWFLTSRERGHPSRACHRGVEAWTEGSVFLAAFERARVARALRDEARCRRQG